MVRTKLLAVPILLCCATPFAAQQRQEGPPDVRLPSGKLQRDEILRADHEKNLEDAGKLLKAAEDLKIAIEKSDPYVLSIDTLKQTEEIEKIARRIRSRMKK